MGARRAFPCGVAHDGAAAARSIGAQASHAEHGVDSGTATGALRPEAMGWDRTDKTGVGGAPASPERPAGGAGTAWCGRLERIGSIQVDSVLGRTGAVYPKGASAAGGPLRRGGLAFTHPLNREERQ